MDEHRRILIIKPSSMGDIIHSLPVLKALRCGNPKARISWVINQGLEDLLDGNPCLDEVIVFKRRDWARLSNILSTSLQVPEFIVHLRRGKFDLCVDLQGLLKSGFMSFVTGAARRVGFESAGEMSHLFYNVKVPIPKGDIHAVDRYMLIPKALNISCDSRDFLVVTTPQDQLFVDNFFKDHRLSGKDEVVAVNPSARWNSKRWFWERYAEVADILNGRDAVRVILIGASRDLPLVNRIASRMKTSPVVAAGELTLKQLTALLQRASLLISNDSGPMHLAAAVGTPVVAIFGPTDPALTGPYGPRHTVVRGAEECAPCFKMDCPRGMECMGDVRVEMVWEAASKYLS